MKHKVRRIVLGITAAVLLSLTGYCGFRWYQSDILPERLRDQANSEQQVLIEQIRPSEQVNQSDNPLASCEAVNDDTVGWIYIPNTNIDLPIVQGEDNDFYLHNGINGQHNHELGCPFLDYRCQSDFSGFNSIVYGHHLKKRQMFTDISLFAQPSFMRSNPEGTLTLSDGRHPVKFFAYLNVHHTAAAYHAVFITQQEKAEYLDYIFSEAKYTQNLTREQLDENARLLLLSTCTYEFTNARGILVGLIMPSA